MSDKEPPGSREPVVRRAVPLPGAAGTPEPDELRAKGEEPSRPVGAAHHGRGPGGASRAAGVLRTGLGHVVRCSGVPAGVLVRTRRR
ncbi:hypothetical protein IHE61_27055 [Streptomyces sp. GKU 257-1]|nr:hypothetical protein [Streptomyces sp. GKU 257-1]